jgi:hypothetical protein
VLLVVATLGAYAGVSRNGFLGIDDPEYVTRNPPVLGGLSADGAVWAFTHSHSGNWHPLTWLSHMLDVELHDLDAPRHHWTSVALHAANAVLLFLLLHSLTGALGRSAFVAGAFALHPLHVESVAWIAERKDVLSSLFALLALLAWVGWVRRRSGLAYAGALALFALGLMAKPMLVTLPCLLLLLDVWPLGRLRAPFGRSVARLVVEKLPWFALSGASAVVTLIVQSRAIREIPFAERFSNALVSYVRYLGAAAWPAKLSPFYPYESGWPWAVVAGAVALLIALSAAALWRVRREPWLAIGWLWFLGALVPVIGLVQVGGQAMADRYMYLPLVGLALAVAWGAHAALAPLRARDAVLGTLAVALLLSWGLATRTQLSHWRDQVTLFRHALSIDPENAHAHAAVGGVLVREGDLEEGLGHVREALRLEPLNRWAHLSLGYGLLRGEDFEGAVREFSWVRAQQPGIPELAFHLGRALEGVHRYEEAVGMYRDELDRTPDHADALRRLAVLLALHPSPELRDPEQAQRLATRLNELTEYGDAGDLDVLAAALGSAHRFEEAERLAWRALERALAGGRDDLVPGIRHRMRRYQARQPLRLELEERAP